MTTYTKPAVRSAWGQTASGSDLQDPGNTYASAGWQIGVKPPRQYFNWVLNYVFNGIRYICQAGIPDWDPAESYQGNQIAKDSQGYIYASNISNNIGNNPVITGSGAIWANPSVRNPVRSVSTSQIINISYAEANFLPVTAAFTAINGQIQNAQVPVGAITQWQGSLSISGGQVTSAVAGANTLLINGGYRSITWSGQSGQPSWLVGSSDGVNFLVWNPANFSVANANTVAGLSVTSAASGNTVMARDGSGIAYAVYFNQASGNNDGSPISQILTTNGSDGFLRKQSVAAVRSAIGALTSANFAFSSGGYQKIADQAIVQGGRVTISGLTTVFFPIAFPHGCFAVVFTNEGSTNQIFLSSAPGTAFFQATNGNTVIDWIAFGW